MVSELLHPRQEVVASDWVGISDPRKIPSRWRSVTANRPYFPSGYGGGPDRSVGKECLGVIGLGSSARKIPSRFRSGVVKLAPALEPHLLRQVPDPSDLRRRLGSAELALAVSVPVGGGLDRRLVKVPGSTPGKIPKPSSDLGKMTKSVVRYEEDAYDHTAVWRIVHLRPSEQPRERELEMARSAEDSWQISQNGTQGTQSMSTPEGNFNFPSTDLSVVVTGWEQDQVPNVSVRRMEWENPAEVCVKNDAQLEDGTVVSKSEGVEFTVKEDLDCAVLENFGIPSWLFGLSLPDAVERAKDLAVLKEDAPTDLLKPINVGLSSALRVGQQCLAIGNPCGFDNTLTVEFTVKDGYFCPALAQAVKTMRKAEKVLLKIKPQNGIGEKGKPAAGEVVRVWDPGRSKKMRWQSSPLGVGGGLTFGVVSAAGRAQTLPKSHHCFSMRLTLEYSKFSSLDSDEPFARKFNNPKRSHYVILSKIVHMGDKANGAVEFCGVRLGLVRNFFGEITYDSKSCEWMSGVNVTNLDKWRKHDVTEDYLLLLKKFKTKDTELFKENVALCSNANAKKGTTGGNDNQNQTDLFNWEDATGISTEKLGEYSCKHSNTGAEVSKDKYGYYQKKKYRRDFLVKFEQSCVYLPEGFKIGFDIVEAVMCIPLDARFIVNSELHPNHARLKERASATSRVNRHMASKLDKDKWRKLYTSPVYGHDPLPDTVHRPALSSWDAAQRVWHGSLRSFSQNESSNQYIGEFLSRAMEVVVSLRSMSRGSVDERWRHRTSIQGITLPSQVSVPLMHKAEKKYEMGNVSDEEEAKQRQPLAIISPHSQDNVNIVETQNLVAQTAIEQLFGVEMTKWFDTNYHFIVPELGPSTKFSYFSHKAVNEYREAKAFGVDTVILPVYKEVIAELKAAGASWIQFDEPTLVLDLDSYQLAAFFAAYTELESTLSGLNVFVKTYFADIPAESYKTLTSLNIMTAYGFDLVRGIKTLDLVKSVAFSSGKYLLAGIVDGRNIWANDLAASLGILQSLESVVGKDKLVVLTSCSLMHTAVDFVNETKLDIDIKSWLAFAAQKVVVVNTLAKALADQKDEAYFAANVVAQSSRRSSPRETIEEVQKAVAALKGSDHRRATNVSARLDSQQKKLNIPVLPTTTIGSFPQTVELRRIRREYKANKISEEEYISAIKEEINKVVKIQEELDIYVLMHGEPERKYMVEYFGEQLSGFAFTANGWVQTNYRSRCVKSPIICGDVSRSNPMTVLWSKTERSMTFRPMKGMFTGPSFLIKALEGKYAAKGEGMSEPAIV